MELGDLETPLFVKVP